MHCLWLADPGLSAAAVCLHAIPDWLLVYANPVCEGLPCLTCPLLLWILQQAQRQLLLADEHGIGVGHL